MWFSYVTGIFFVFPKLVLQVFIDYKGGCGSQMNSEAPFLGFLIISEVCVSHCLLFGYPCSFLLFPSWNQSWYANRVFSIYCSFPPVNCHAWIAPDISDSAFIPGYRKPSLNFLSSLHFEIRGWIFLSFFLHPISILLVSTSFSNPGVSFHPSTWEYWMPSSGKGSDYEA